MLMTATYGRIYSQNNWKNNWQILVCQCTYRYIVSDLQLLTVLMFKGLQCTKKYTGNSERKSILLQIVQTALLKMHLSTHFTLSE